MRRCVVARRRARAAAESELDASASSQYLSALLLAGQRAAGPVEIEVPALSSAPYVDLTLDMIERFGGRVDAALADPFRDPGPSELAGGTVEIEADFSAAAYPAAAAALTGGSIRVAGVEPRARSRATGASSTSLLRWAPHVSWGPDEVAIEKRRACRDRRRPLRRCPDQVPTLAALAPFARGTTRIRNVAHLRIKESDRLAAMASELRRAGARVEELPDGLVIPGSLGRERTSRDTGDRSIRTTTTASRWRWRSSGCGVRTSRSPIRPASAKSYPAFWRDLATWLGATV